ncbi:hypothetical protein MSG28_009392 [Choristoneura fumiferana]|uniref:Uncharacterized protein n=1 Tax=Choristoneura fumiferana TaxID=7141 RepID=A0ACC0KXV2_CHOFU|nr:hypothetical protein MSG28_009392 [Choristoneura fumiferana]
MANNDKLWHRYLEVFFPRRATLRRWTADRSATIRSSYLLTLAESKEVLNDYEDICCHLQATNVAIYDNKHRKKIVENGKTNKADPFSDNDDDVERVAKKDVEKSEVKLPQPVALVLELIEAARRFPWCPRSRALLARLARLAGADAPAVLLRRALPLFPAGFVRMPTLLRQADARPGAAGAAGAAGRCGRARRAAATRAAAVPSRLPRGRALLARLARLAGADAPAVLLRRALPLFPAGFVRMPTLLRQADARPGAAGAAGTHWPVRDAPLLLLHARVTHTHSRLPRGRALLARLARLAGADAPAVLLRRALPLFPAGFVRMPTLLRQADARPGAAGAAGAAGRCGRARRAAATRAAAVPSRLPRGRALLARLARLAGADAPAVLLRRALPLFPAGFVRMPTLLRQADARPGAAGAAGAAGRCGRARRAAATRAAAVPSRLPRGRALLARLARLAGADAPAVLLRRALPLFPAGFVRMPTLLRQADARPGAAGAAGAAGRCGRARRAAATRAAAVPSRLPRGRALLARLARLAGADAPAVLLRRALPLFPAGFVRMPTLLRQADARPGAAGAAGAAGRCGRARRAAATRAAAVPSRLPRGRALLARLARLAGADAPAVLLRRALPLFPAGFVRMPTLLRQADARPGAAGAAGAAGRCGRARRAAATRAAAVPSRLPRGRALLARLARLAGADAPAVLLRRALPLFPAGFVRMPTLLRQADARPGAAGAAGAAGRCGRARRAAATRAAAVPSRLPRGRALLARLARLAGADAPAVLLRRALPLFPAGFVRMPTLLRQADARPGAAGAAGAAGRCGRARRAAATRAAAVPSRLPRGRALLARLARLAGADAPAVLLRRALPLFQPASCACPRCCDRLTRGRALLARLARLAGADAPAVLLRRALPLFPAGFVRMPTLLRQADARPGAAGAAGAAGRCGRARRAAATRAAAVPSRLPRGRALLARLARLAGADAPAVLLRRALPLFPAGFVRMPTLLRQADLNKELKVSDVKRQRPSSQVVAPAPAPAPAPPPPAPAPEQISFPSSLTVTTTLRPLDTEEDKEKTKIPTVFGFPLSKELIVETPDKIEATDKSKEEYVPNSIGSITITPVVSQKEKKMINATVMDRKEPLLRVKSPAMLNEMAKKEKLKPKEKTQNVKEKRVDSPLHVDTSYQPNKKEPTPSPTTKEEVTKKQIENMRVAENNIPRPALVPVHHSPTFAKPDKRPPEVKKKKEIVIISDLDPLGDVQPEPVVAVDDSSSDVEVIEDSKSEHNNEKCDPVPSKDKVSVDSNHKKEAKHSSNPKERAKEKPENHRREKTDDLPEDDFSTVMKNLKEMEHSQETPKFNSFGGVLNSAKHEKSSKMQFGSRNAIFGDGRNDKDKLANFFEQNGWM